MTVPKTIFTEEQVYGGTDNALADAMLEAMQGGTGIDELTLAFLKEHEEQSLEMHAACTNYLKRCGSKTNNHGKKRTKRGSGVKLARKMLRL